MGTCRDCEAEEGEFHALGCFCERCPFCAGQLVSCNCVYEKLGLIDESKYTKATAFMPPDVYNDGLDSEQEDAWEEILEAKGRVPYRVPQCVR